MPIKPSRKSRERRGPFSPRKSSKRHPRSFRETGVFLHRLKRFFGAGSLCACAALERGGEPFHVRRIRRRRLMMGRTSPYSASSEQTVAVGLPAGRPRGGGPAGGRARTRKGPPGIPSHTYSHRPQPGKESFLDVLGSVLSYLRRNRMTLPLY